MHKNLNLRLSIATRVTAASIAMLSLLLVLLALSLDVGRQVRTANEHVSVLTRLLAAQEVADKAQRKLRLSIGDVTRLAEQGRAVPGERWRSLSVQMDAFKTLTLRSRVPSKVSTSTAVSIHIEASRVASLRFVDTADNLLEVARRRPTAVKTEMTSFLSALRDLERWRAGAREALMREIDEAVRDSVANTRRSMLRFETGAVGALMILFALTIWLRRRVIKPMVEIAVGLRDLEIDQRAIEPPPFVDRRDEVGDLARGLLEYRLSVCERQEAQRRIDFLAHHDDLTGLPNRLVFETRLGQELQRSARTSDSVAVLAIDLDDFKAINDRRGHAGGDEALRHAGQMLTRCARADDLVARIGGDEFAIIQVAQDQPNAARALLSRIFEVTGETDDDLVARMSIGVAISGEGQDSEELHKQADVALYRAKSDGRNTARFFDETMQAEARLRRRLSTDLQHAVQAGELHVCYRPIANVGTMAVTGYEALLCWRHPELGIVPPAVFIPIAEANEEIDDLGRWMANEVLAEMASWRSELTVSMNLSRVQFRRLDLATALLDLAERHGVTPQRIEFHVTEEALVGSRRENVLTSLNRLQDAGAKIAFENFGRGQASLANLLIFTFDRLKIDGSLISAMGLHEHSASIVKAAIAIGRTLGVPVVAGGVETHQQLDRLREWGCDQIQGPLAGGAITGDELGRCQQSSGVVGQSRALRPHKRR